MVPRAIALSVRDGAARNLAGCARWCPAQSRWLHAMGPRAGSLATRDGAPRNRASSLAARDVAPRNRAGHFSHEGRLVVREMAY